MRNKFAMADTHSKEVRSYNMSRIRSKDTNPEIIVRHFLHANGYRYKLHDKNLPGTPDIVLPKYRTIIFVHGCFWHGHNGCRYFVIPKTRSEWWSNKIFKRREKDKADAYTLREKGWSVVSIFECELRPLHREKTLNHLNLYLKAPLTDSLNSDF